MTALATLTLRGGADDSHGWPTGPRVDYSSWGVGGTCVPHPRVEGVWIGDAGALEDLPPHIDAVVSLCRVGTAQIPDGISSHVVRLIDSTATDNPNVDFIIDDAARTVLRLRDQGRQVFLHCVAGQSRTPTVAARVAVLEGASVESALEEVTTALPGSRPQRWLIDSLYRVSTTQDRP